MSWGALNNQRERTSAEPLPEFLTGQTGKSYHDRQEPQFQATENVVVRKSERQPYVPRQEMNRGYGMMYPGSINIQLSKKTLFISMVFFVMIILATFCVGYGVGNLSVSMSVGQASVNAPIKKPIIPARKKIKQEVRAAKKNVEVIAAETASPANEENNSQVSSEKNNNKENDSETIDEAPQSAADTNDVAD